MIHPNKLTHTLTNHPFSAVGDPVSIWAYIQWTNH
jgi:hypothetical protein